MIIDNNWGAVLANMQLIRKFDKGFRFLLCVIDINISKYALVIPLKDKKGITITVPYQKILDEFNRKPNKTLVDKGSDFYNGSIKYGYKIRIQKCIQYITKGNLLLFKDSLEP